jgi:membrane associated rhomboid family serine protease
MTPAPPIATFLIIVATGVISFLAFRNGALRDGLIFSPQAILANKEYYRVVTSAFLHADWQHLLFNMVSLGLFGQIMEPAIGIGRFVLIYFASIIGGSLVSLYLHRHHEYFVLGASGGVCGIVFSSIFLFPGESIGSLFLPFGIPGWL